MSSKTKSIALTDMIKLFESCYLRAITETRSIEQRKTVALIGGAFKPPTAGHFDMVQQYLKKADEVIIIISNPQARSSLRATALGKVINPEDSKKIWEIILKRYNLVNDVKVIVSPKPSPITAVYDFIENDLKDVDVILGVSKKDDDWRRYLRADQYFRDRPDIQILDVEKNAVTPLDVGPGGDVISATAIRQNIMYPDIIKKYLPEKLTEEDIRKIMEILWN